MTKFICEYCVKRGVTTITPAIVDALQRGMLRRKFRVLSMVCLSVAGVGKIYRQNLESLTKFALQKLAQVKADGSLTTRGSKGRLEKLMAKVMAPYGLEPVPMNTLRRFDKATDPETKGFSEGQSADNMARMAISFGIFDPSGYDLTELGQRRRMVNAANAAMVRWLDTPGAFESWQDSDLAKDWPESVMRGEVPLAPPRLRVVESPQAPASFDIENLTYDELIDLAAIALNTARHKREDDTDVRKHVGANLLASEITKLEATSGGDGEAIVAYQMRIDKARLRQILDGDIMTVEECQGAALLTGLSAEHLTAMGACLSSGNTVERDG